MKAKIMVLDDEPLILELLETSLSRDGFSVLCVASEEEFWSTVKLHEIDLFLLDLNLPDGNGLNIAKKIRATSDVGIIILSGRTDEIDRIVSLELGADDYVTKPYSPRELSARISSVLRRTNSSVYRMGDDAQKPIEKSKNVRFDGWELKLDSRRVIAPNGEDIELTTTEFDFLKAFVLRPNQVLSRQQLMDATKGQDWVCYDRAVDGLVSRLRRKVSPGSDSAQSHYIKTIRGIGYMFSP